MIQIKDLVSLRQVSAELATRTISAATGFNSRVAYDINNHIAIAKAIEKYIKGEATLPEIDNPIEPWKEIMAKMQDSFQKPSDPKAPNFEVKE